MRFKSSFQITLLALALLSLANFDWRNRTGQLSSVSARATSINQQPFYLGMFEDANLTGGNTDVFRSMVADLTSRGLDTVMFSNNDSERDAPLLNVSDELNFNVLMIPAADLHREWWPSDVPANLETALAVAEPIVNRWKPHPSLKAYLTKDEPVFEDLEKVSLINEAFQTLDPSRPAMPILIGASRVGPIFNASHASIMLIDVYPVGARNELCDLTMTGFGYPDLDFVDYIRTVIKDKPASVPFWIILQTHNFLDQLREPIAAEVREQHWLAIGEGAKAIFWFIYSSQQGWRGLRDNPELYAEVTSLTQRTIPLRDTLLGLQKTEDSFTISRTGNYTSYISTLISADNRYFIVAVNRDCQNSQDLAIHASSLGGQLRDVETAAIYNLDTPISFLPGDGKIFELVSGSEVTPTDTSTQTEIPPTHTETPTHTLMDTPIPTETSTNTPTNMSTVTPTNTLMPPRPIPSPDMLIPLLDALLQRLLEQLREIISFR